MQSILTEYVTIQANGNPLTPIPEDGIANSVEIKQLLRFLLRPTDLPTCGALRSEVTKNPEPYNVLRRYNFSFLFQTNWINEIGGTQSLFQIHGTEDFADCHRSPCFALLIQNDQMCISVRSDFNAVSLSNPKDVVLYRFPLIKGRFVEFELQAKWAFDSSGLIRVFVDKKLVVEFKGPNCYNDKIGPYAKIGLYHWEKFPLYIQEQEVFCTNLIVENVV